MSVVSLTFHTEESALPEWDIYVHEELALMVDNLMDAEKYILSEVDSEMLNEGKNTNLFLVFDNDKIRSQFLENEFVNIAERVEQKFGTKVLIFKTLINPMKSRF